MAENKKANRGFLASMLGCYCPRCREGKLFENPISFDFGKLLKMHKKCPVCGQPTELEVGFYYGTSYVSYALSVAISVASAIAWWLFVGFSVDDNRFLYWIIVNAVLLVVLQPLLMRLARSVWIHFFVKYDPDWQEHDVNYYERTNDAHSGNW